MEAANKPTFPKFENAEKRIICVVSNVHPTVLL